MLLSLKLNPIIMHACMNHLYEGLCSPARLSLIVSEIESRPCIQLNSNVIIVYCIAAALFVWSLFNVLNSCAKLMKGTSLIESLGMTGEAAKRFDQIIEVVHRVHASMELMKSIADLHKGSESEGIKKVKVVIKALRKQQQLWQEVFNLHTQLL